MPHVSPALASELQSVRRARQLSLGGLALRCGVNKATLSRWESGQSFPRVPELTAVMDALNVPQTTRTHWLTLIPAPRSLHILRKETASLPFSRGEILRALRLRAGRTQAEVAQKLSVHTTALSRWERGDLWPGDAQLHALCFALGASAEEAVILTNQTFLPDAPTLKSYEAVQDALQAIQTQALTEEVSDLAYLTLTLHLLRHVREGRAEMLDVARVWAAHSTMLPVRRRAEAFAYGERALAVLDQSRAPLDDHFHHLITILYADWHLPHRMDYCVSRARHFAARIDSNNPHLEIWAHSNIAQMTATLDPEEGVRCAARIYDNAPDDGMSREAAFENLIYAQIMGKKMDAALKNLDKLPPVTEERGALIRQKMRCMALINGENWQEAETAVTQFEAGMNKINAWYFKPRLARFRKQVTLRTTVTEPFRATE